MSVGAGDHPYTPEPPCDNPKCACRQLAWLREMERIEQEVFPDARPRSEVVVEIPDGMPEDDGGVGYGTF